MLLFIFTSIRKLFSLILRDYLIIHLLEKQFRKRKKMIRNQPTSVRLYIFEVILERISKKHEKDYKINQASVCKSINFSVKLKIKTVIRLVNIILNTYEFYLSFIFRFSFKVKKTTFFFDLKKSNLSKKCVYCTSLNLNIYLIYKSIENKV